VLWLLFTAGAVGAPNAYVANEKSGTLSIVDTERAGGKPRGMALSRDGRLLYVSDQTANALLVVDLQERSVRSKIDLGSVIDTPSYQKLRDIAVGELPWGVIVH
jgi:DNA-binding beta-propeller fold protein YncE